MSDHQSFSFVLIYRPEKGPQADSNRSAFFDEFCSLLDNISITATKDKLYLLGDFNFHLDNPNHPDSKRLLEILEQRSLLQHVNSPTNDKGHVLDLLISRIGDSSIADIEVTDPSISDHCAVSFVLRMVKPSELQKTICYRTIKAIDADSFASDLTRRVKALDLASDLETLTVCYDKVLRNTLDQHAPAKSKRVTVRPNAPWFSDEIVQERKTERKLERKFRRSKLTIDRQIWKHQARLVDSMIETAKEDHFAVQAEESSTVDTFRTVNSLLYGKKNTVLPSHECANELAERFSAYFANKVQLIRESFPDQDGDEQVHEQYLCSSKLDEFKPVTSTEFVKLLGQMRATSCSLDPIPTPLLKKCTPGIVELMIAIINSSLSCGVVPDSFKRAILNPLIKKPSLDADVLKNYRPVSNLCFLSKVLERVVANQLSVHLDSNDLREPFQ
ncbi:uncharacterized protein LOC135489943 [Lineus longissimus]|uniref:uncharacterized protein LOC135489943 n=1 Tax=Lineus longissimus TaxID=88925 RepID=UPI00315CBE04